MKQFAAAPPTDLRRASVKDTLATLTDTIIPTLAKGVVIRRPAMVALAERLNLDGRAVKRMQRLRARYGAGPLMLTIPGRSQAVLLSSDHVHRVLEGTPQPFSPATAGKRAALAHFEPRVSLISDASERIDRRGFNERVLQHSEPVHSLVRRFLAVVDHEGGALLARANGSLDWDGFTVAWHRVVRRVVLGEEARDDHALTDMLAKLRTAGNWAFLHPGRKRLRDAYHRRLNAHLARAEPGSLAELIAAAPKTAATAPADQVSQWLFAFDPGGMAAFRALALIASHPDAGARARADAATALRDGSMQLPFLRACILESLRLWPTTPAILRETQEDTLWSGKRMPKNTSILIFAPFFHRDDEILPFAHRFTPGIWLDEEEAHHAALVPFSGGPGICPGRHVVTVIGSAMIARIIGDVAI